MSVFRDVVDDIFTDLQANVPALATARLYRHAPVWYPADVCLAAWLAGEEVMAEGPTGARHYIETYLLRYWEPAVFDEATAQGDDEEILTFENLYESVRARFQANQTFGDAAPLWVAAGKLLDAGEADNAFVRGWELKLQGSRYRPFTD